MLHSANRDCKNKFGPGSERARDANLSAVRFDYSLCNRQTEACAEMCRVLCLPESVEHLREIRLRDSGSRVGDGELNGFRRTCCGEADFSSFGRELYRVTAKVRNNLKKPVTVDVHPR
jgi:hypothetical protein